MRYARPLLVMIYALLWGLVSQAQTKPTISPVTSTEGYDFYATFLPNGVNLSDTTSLKLQLLVSAREVPGHPEIKADTIGIQCGSGEEQEDYVPVNSTKLVTLTVDKAYWKHSGAEAEKALDKGVHVYSKNGVKMTVYAINQVGNTTSNLMLDGAHVLPKQALGHEYIVTANSNEKASTEFAIISTMAGTTVNIQLPSGVSTTTGKRTLTVQFQKPNQIYIVRSRPDAAEDGSSSSDLSGTRICADHPVAVWSGNQAASFPTDKNASEDHTYDQLLPIDRWGTQFIVPMTGLHTQINKLDIIAREDGTHVTVKRLDATGSKDTQTWTSTPSLSAAEKWPILVDANHPHGIGHTIEDSIMVVTADKPIQVHLHTSSSIYNAHIDDGNHLRNQGDPSMTMITPLEHLTDTAVFATYYNSWCDSIDHDTKRPLCDTIRYEIVIWAKRSTTSSLKYNNQLVSQITSFKNLPGYSDYQFARIPVDATTAEKGYQILTAAEKGFGGYVCGLAEGQAVLYPVGYSFESMTDSLFLSKQYEPKEIHGAEFNTKYPDTSKGGGWYLDKIVQPKQPTQYDTIFICDSTKLRFPAIIHNYSKEHGDSIKWEIMRIEDKTQKRSIYKHEDTDELKYEYKEGDFNEPIPFMETKFFVSPEKNVSALRRPLYEDFEVYAVLYRKPALCEEEDKDKWPKDTLSTIVRTYRSYNDTTWLIRCTNDDTEGARDIVKKDGEYYIKFFVDPETKEGQLTHLTPGVNGPFTHIYNTVNGCEKDSIVTLNVLLCESEVIERPLGIMCEDELKDIRDHLDGFFQSFDFFSTFDECKKQNKNAYNWTNRMATDLVWHFEGEDIIRKHDCDDLMQQWHDMYGAAYPRPSIGCDRKLKLTMDVMPVKDTVYEYTTCKNQYLWSFDYKWINSQGRYKEHKEILCKLSDPNMHAGNNDTIFEYKKEAEPGSGKFCVSERHILHLTFIRDNNPHVKSIPLCQDDDSLVVDKASDPDIVEEDFRWVFYPNKYEPGGPYSSGLIPCKNDQDCEYNLEYRITVNPVDVHRDTIVYCYDDGSEVPHTWDGHTSFWANIKGQPNTRKHYDANHPLKIKRPEANKDRDTRIIYELADTIPSSPCHELYYQTVILLPPYSSSAKHDPISTEQWFEWHDVIWAGEKVNTDTIPNPRGKKVIQLIENQYAQEVPEGWTVDYLKADYLYALKTTTTVQTYKREDGSETHPCDSTVQLLIQIADVQRDSTYAYTCSDDSPYEWQAGDTTIYIDLSAYYAHPEILPRDTILLEDRKTVNDPRLGEMSWPVAGIDAHFYRHLTIFPAYDMAVESAACQKIGGTVEFKGITFPLDDDITLSKENRYTIYHTWVHPHTGESIDIPCDSIEGVRMVVHPIYTEDLNKERSTHQRTLYSHDTLTFFTEPKTLFVGQDFFYTHPEVRDLDELKSKAGVSAAIVIDSTLVDALHRTSEDRNGMYHSSQPSISGTKELSCDSTTFLDLKVYKTEIVPPVNLGDNGEVLEDGVTEPWSFGGIAALGHTHPYITGDYFRFYYDENGNIVDEVDYTNPNYNRGGYYCNPDGTRTYLLVDSVLQDDGSYKVIAQNITVYPTFKISANDREGLGIVEKCQSDEFEWEGHVDKDGNVLKVYVSKLDVNINREAEVRDTLCAKQYANRVDRLGNSLCVDSIAILKLKVYGNGEVKQTHSRCFNDSIWAPDWKPTARVYYTAGGGLSQTVDNVLPSEGSGGLCKDSFVVTVTFEPAYGIAPYKWGDQTDSIRHRNKYIQPYIYDTVVCWGDDEFQWLVKQGDTYVKHTPKNLYLYKYDGRYNDEPDNRYWDTQNNPTNKVPGNKIPTDFDIGSTYTVRDSLKTQGGACDCDSVLTLNYTIQEALPAVTIDTTICLGESYPFGDEILTEPVKDYVKYIQVEGLPCKTKTTLNLKVMDASSFTVDSAQVCYPSPSQSTARATYALHYSFRGTPPTKFSVYYDDIEAEDLEFKNIKDSTITGNLTEGTDYVIDLPLPKNISGKPYPTPGTYKAKIGFQNGICLGEDLMTYDLKLKVNYPDWVMVKRHGDLIALLDDGHAWNNFEWYKNGNLMRGYTKPYLYVPEGLLEDGEQEAEYYAVLTETDITGDIISSAPTCPIVVKDGMPYSGMGPTSDYIAVTPTCLPINGEGDVFIHILSSENGSGEYRITTVEGQFVTKGDFKGNATKVKMNNLPEGMYIVQVSSYNKESKEAYRAVKVIVRKTCPNCDKSSF